MRNRIVDAIWYLVMFVILQLLAYYLVIFIWSVVEGKGFSGAIQAIQSVSSVKNVAQTIVVQAVFSLLALVVFLCARWCRVSPSYLRTRPWGVCLWAAVAALGTIIPSEVFIEIVPLPDLNSDMLKDVMMNRWGYLAICIFAPLVEELVFRGAILRALLDGMRRHWLAIALSALFFALVHANPAQMPHAFCLGLLLGWMYYRTGSVIPGIVVHWVNNTVAYVVCNLYPQAVDMRIIDLWGGSTVKVTLAVVFSLLIFLPAVVQLHLRMRKASSRN